MRLLLILAATITALLAPAHQAAAQGFPRHERGGSSRDDSGASDRSGSRMAAAAPSDPFSALERELLSLTVDIQLKADQVDAWNSFERDVRSVAELGRAQRRRLMALPESGDAAPPTALSFIASLAEDDRQKADAVADLQRHLQALYDKLDETQRRMLDRRVVQSQAEPLGP